MATRWLRIGGGVLATVVLAAVVWWCLSSEAGLNRWLARSWARGLSHGSAEQVASDLRYIAALDEAGLDTLLDALGSSRTDVSEAAAQALHERLGVWRHWPHERSNQLAERLSKGLAERVGGWPATAQRVAADIALQLLDWPVDTQRGARPALMVHCECILRSVPALSAPAPSDAAVQRARERREAKEAGSQPGLLTPPSDSVDVADRPQPAPAEVPDLAAGLVIQPALTQRSDTSPGHSREDSPIPWPTDTDGSLQGFEAGADGTAATTSVDATTSDVTTSDAATKALQEKLSKQNDLDLIHALGSTDPNTAMQAWKELRRRGFREYEFKLASKFISPDPAQRRQVAHLVHGLPSGAARWLIWLSEDPDRSVRQAAVSLMLTARDPLVEQRLRKMEVTDGDESICELIREWRERR